MTTVEKQQFVKLLAVFILAREDDIKDILQQAGITPEEMAAKCLIQFDLVEVDDVIKRMEKHHMDNFFKETELKYPEQVKDGDEYMKNRTFQDILESRGKSHIIPHGVDTSK